MSKKLLSLLLIAALCLSLAPAGLAEEIRIVDPVGANTQINDTEADAPAPCHPERSEAEPKDLSEDSSAPALLRMTDETNEIVASGACGDNLTWTLDDEGTLTIEGSGDMWEYDYWGDVPWSENNERINTVVVYDGATSISALAFFFCRSMTSVTIPDSVTSIGNHAFAYCNSLTNVTIPDNVTIIDTGVFLSCSSLTSVTIPDGVTSIGHGAFQYCSGLTSVTIPDSVTSIGDLVFNNCNSLTSITIPNNVTNIGQYVFQGCSSLTSAVIGNSVTSISEGTFYECDSLTSVTIPDSVTSIGDNAFEFCSNLTSVTIPDNLTIIGAEAFAYCHDLTSITIPDGMRSIGSRAFWYCCLTSVTIPDSVTSVGNGAFGCCSSLTGILVDEGNEHYSSLGGVLFDKEQTVLFQFPCGKEGAYTIPDSVTSIDDWAFADCIGMTSVTIPDSMTIIGYYAFVGCSSLTDVFFRGAAPTIEWDIFRKVTATAYYPEGDETWTEDVMQDYGGTITWMPYTPGEGYAVAIDEEKLPEGVTVTLPEGDSFSGEVTFTVSSPEDQAVLVAVKNGDGSYNVLPCTDKDGCHCFTLNVTENTELVLVYKGDANLDGQVKLKDNLMVKKHIAKSEQIADPLAVLAVDTDGSGEIKLRDNLMIKKHIAKSQMIGW